MSHALPPNRSADVANQPLAGVTANQRLLAVGIAWALPSLVTWIYFVQLAGQPSGWQQLAYALGKLLQFAFPVVWVVGFAREPLRRFPSTARGAAWGVATGFVIVSAMFALYFGWLASSAVFAGMRTSIEQKVLGFGLSTPVRFAGLAAFYAVVHSGLEEYYWRWFVFGQLAKCVSLPLAVGVSSLGFMAHHVILLSRYFGWHSPWTSGLSACVAVGGVLWAWMYWKYQSLCGPWLSHLLVDAGIFALGYEIIRHSFVAG